MTAIPGELTTAALALRLWQPGVRTVVVPFDQILDEVRAGKVDAGVVIHEGQLTYEDEGLVAVVDLGAWWKEETGDPLPLGGNGIRRDLDPALSRRLCRLLTESIAYALDHRQEALDYAMRYARGLEDDPVAVRPLRRHVRQRVDARLRRRSAAAPCSACSIAATTPASCRSA